MRFSLDYINTSESIHLGLVRRVPDDPITATIHLDYSQFTYKDLLLRGDLL